MHGLINRCIEAFICSNYDRDTWNQVVTKVGIKADSFLTWNEVSDNITYSIVITSTKILEKSINEFLEDMGSWLTRQEKIRRLLRFSGSSFEEFTESLGELPDRIRLIIPSLDVPDLETELLATKLYQITTSKREPGLLRVIAGILRGMADDYGTLAIITVKRDRIKVAVAISNYVGKRHFALSPLHGDT